MSSRRGRGAVPAAKRQSRAAGGSPRATAPTRRAARLAGTAASVAAPRLPRPGAAQPARELDAAIALGSLAERPASLLEMGGEGALQRALADFAREQDRQANRAWRRPGGLARLGWV